jgi:hypothetical protein
MAKYNIEEILPLETLQYASDTSFPWSLDHPLRPTEVTEHLFHTSDATLEKYWNVSQIRESLQKLASIGVDHLRLDDFIEFVNSAEDGDDRRLRLQGTILLLSRGSRVVCKGVNARYVYDYFQPIAIRMISGIIGDGAAVNLSDWEAAGIDKNQAIIRMLMTAWVLIESDLSESREKGLKFLERLIGQYERLTHTHDPFHASYERDCRNEMLLGQMRKEGPPTGRGVHLRDVVYWVARMFRAHLAVGRKFGRDPERNVCCGREDSEAEREWLEKMGIVRTDEDEEVRQRVQKDVKQGTWTALDLH